MGASKGRDEFLKPVKEAVAKRVRYECSNPRCRGRTLFPCEGDPGKFMHVGVVAHITAAAPGGPRYDANFTPDQRSSADNAIHLCANCAQLIDKNRGLDFPPGLLRKWKKDHEAECTQKGGERYDSIVIVDGEHHAKGKGRVTGLDVQGPVLLRPGTKSTAEGEGEITATRISWKGGKK